MKEHTETRVEQRVAIDGGSVKYRKLNGNAFTVESEQLIRAHEAGLNIDTKKVSCKYKGLETSTKGPTSHGLSILSYIIKLIAYKRPLKINKNAIFAYI